MPARLFQIASEHFFEYGRSTPSIQKQVMMAPDKLISLFCYIYQREMHERRFSEVEFATPSFFQVSLQMLLLFIRIEMPPIILFYFQLHSALHYLQRLCHALPGYPCAQNRMPVDYLLPRRFESANIQIPFQLTTQLRHIDAGVRLAQAVKEHSLLYRRERVDVFDLTVRSAQLIQCFLVQSGERKIRRRVTTGFG